MRPESDIMKEVMERSGQDITKCYQCLKCFVGCPLAPYMEYKPNQVIRMLQYGQTDKILESNTIWLCVSCKTCGVRCPNDIDLMHVMDTLREMSQETKKQYKADKKIVALHEEFVRNVKIWGKLHEATFFMPYMARTLDIIDNAGQGIKLFIRLKLPLIPKKIKHIKEIRKLFKKGYKTKKELANNEN
ncbi:4Fe-4S dicluster domain-containing protein [bacterium]|nr:4Fe-4S dicluster domain-containing protein [bacterium]